MNDGGGFGKVFLDIYLTELKLTVEHNGSHETFLDLGIYIDKGKFICMIFDKGGAFDFDMVRTSSITTNILSIIFYSSTMSEFVIIARSTYHLKTFCL